MSAPSKSPTALKTIREVADELSLEPHVLRFWEKEFPQIKPMKRGAGRRYYRAEDVAQLRRIQSLLHDQGYTIKGARALLGGRKAVVAANNSTPMAKNSLRQELKGLHQQLLSLREKISTAL